MDDNRSGFKSSRNTISEIIYMYFHQSIFTSHDRVLCGWLPFVNFQISINLLLRKHRTIATKLCNNNVCEILCKMSSFLFDLSNKNMAAMSNSLGLWLAETLTRAPPTGAGRSTFSYLILNCKQFTKLYILLTMMVI